MIHSALPITRAYLLFYTHTLARKHTQIHVVAYAGSTAGTVTTVAFSTIAAFVATCGEITNGGGVFADASCDSTGAARVYDATKSAATTPNDANCCKAAVPVLSSVAVSSITKTAASLAATSDKNGFIYYSVLAAASSTPSAAGVKTAGEATKTASTAASAATIAISSFGNGVACRGDAFACVVL